jgi:hypothetical protein
MAQMQNSFSQELLEKLIPSARKPVSDIALGLMVPSMDTAGKAKLKMELQKCWAQCHQRMDHRPLCDNTVEVAFAKQTHFIAKAAVSEFDRLKTLYNQYYTVGLKQSLDTFAQQHKAVAEQSRFDVSGWRLGSSNVSDFRRRNGERLLLVSHVRLLCTDNTIEAKTSNISNGGCLLLVEPEQAGQLVLLDKIVIEFSELAKKFALEDQEINYQIVDIKPAGDVYKVALKRTEDGDSSEFDQLVQQLMNEHKRRNRLNVDNTIKALSARCHNMASIAQLNGLIVMSNRNNRYHLLVTQGHTLSLQGELLLNQDVIPHMTENTDSGTNRLFYVWASSQKDVYIGELSEMAQKEGFQTMLKTWRNAVWHKAFMVKANPIDAQLADLGTSIPSNVSPIASKLNAPLPAKVAQFTRELSKISVIEDVTYLMDGLTPNGRQSGLVSKLAERFKLKPSQGRLRQVPFNIKELPAFYDTYRFSHDCELSHGNKHFKIVNGHANCREAVVSLPLKEHKLRTGSKVTISWMIDGTRISLDAKVIQHHYLHKRTHLRFSGESKMVRHLFAELTNLNAFDPAFVEDVQANKLDVAIRNLVLSNLPSVAIFAQAKKQGMVMRALTGHQYLPEFFIDDNNRVKLDALFSQQILLKLANSDDCHKEILFIGVDGEKIVERRLLSEYSSAKLMIKVLQHLCKTCTLYAFALDLSRSRPTAQDDIISIENKYIKHYSPGKAKKLEASLAFNISIGLVDISDTFCAFAAHCK